MRTKLLILAVLALLLAITGPACGQGVTLPAASSRFAWSPPTRQMATVLSNVTLGSEIALDTFRSFRDEHRGRALWRQGCGLLVAQGATQASKYWIHQMRPDGSDDNSCWSGHAATEIAARGWGVTGAFRIGAGKHDVIDVAVGALVGAGARYLCERLIQ